MADKQRHVFFICNGETKHEEEEKDSDLQCVFLPHPKYDRGARYLIRGTTIMEIQRTAQHPSSWFLGNYLESNGSFFVCTPVDPLFLALPLLFKARNKTKDQQGLFIELPQILKNEQFPEISMLQPLLEDKLLGLVCDIKDGWNSNVFRLNDDKLTTWLKAKTSRLRTVLQSHPSFDSTYLRDAEKEKQATISAVGMLSEYLAQDILKILMDEFSITAGDLTSKKKEVKAYESVTVTGDADTARAVTEDLKRKGSGKEAANKNSKLAKIDTKGMKSLACMFGAAPKKK